jgi:hypothetical protein
MGFFSRRRQRESAVPPAETQPSEALGSFASSEDQPVVGSQVSGAEFGDFGGTPGMTEGLAALNQLGPMIQQAMASGNVQVSVGEPQTVDAAGTDLGAEIKEIMRRNGIDPDSGQASVNAADYGEMQKQMLEALSRHGIDPGASGTSLNFGEGDEK